MSQIKLETSIEKRNQPQIFLSLPPYFDFYLDGLIGNLVIARLPIRRNFHNSYYAKLTLVPNKFQKMGGGGNRK